MDIHAHGTACDDLLRLGPFLLCAFAFHTHVMRIQIPKPCSSVHPRTAHSLALDRRCLLTHRHKGLTFQSCGHVCPLYPASPRFLAPRPSPVSSAKHPSTIQLRNLILLIFLAALLRFRTHPTAAFAVAGRPTLHLPL